MESLPQNPEFRFNPENFHAWENGEEKQNTSEPLIDADKTIQEWNLLKRTADAKQYPRREFHNKVPPSVTK